MLVAEQAGRYVATDLMFRTAYSKGLGQPRDARMKPIQRGQLEIHPELNEIAGPAGRQRVEPQAIAVLNLLAHEPGKVWSREALLDEAWGERVVSDATLTGVISRLRHSLRTAGVDDVRIETRSKRGYRLVIEHADSPAESGRRRRFRLIAAVPAALLAVIATTWLLWPPPQLASLQNVKLAFEIKLPDGERISPEVWLREGTEGLIQSEGDYPLDIRFTPQLESTGLIRLSFRAATLSHWAGFDHVLALDTDNEFSLPASVPGKSYRVHFRAEWVSAVDVPVRPQE